MKQSTIFPSAALPKSTKKAEAQRWIEGARWHVLTMTSSRRLDSADGQPKVTMQVFAIGAPRAMLREVLEELAETTPVKDLVIDATVQPGTWHHKTAFWRRDDRGNPLGDASLTIIRILSDGEASEEGVVEDGCGTRMSIRYVFDAAGIEDLSALPNAGAQGFSHKIGGVSRDPETYLLSYYVTTTEQLTVYTPEYISNADAFMTEYTEEWTGLRGTQEAPVSSDGVAVPVPNPGILVPGTLLQVRWEKDPQFCTWNMKVVKRVAKQNVEGVSACDKDLFKEVDAQQTLAQTARLGHAPAATGGLSVQHTSKPREDGLFDNNVQNNQEAEVAEIRKSVTIGQRSIVTEVQDTNRTPLPMPGSSEVGATVVNQRTAGNWYQRTRRTVTIRALALLRLMYREDLFKREYSETKVKALPDPDPGFPGGGLSLSSESRLNEENTWDATRSEDQEKVVAEASKTVAVGQRSIVTEIQDIGTTPLPYPESSEVGTTVTNKKTPGNWFQRTRRQVTIRALALLRVGYREDLYKREYSTTTVKAAPDPDPGFPAGGLSVSSESRLNEENTWDATRSDDQEKLVVLAKKSVSVGLRSVVTETQDITGAEGTYPSDNEVGASVSTERTPGGIFRRTARQVRARLLGILRVLFNETLYKKVSSTTVTKDVPEIDPGFAGDGLVKTTDSRLSDENTWDVSIENDQEKAVARSSVRKVRSNGIIRSQVTDTNSQDLSEDLAAGTGSTSLDIEKTPGNRRNRTVITYELAPDGEGKVIRHSKGGDFRSNFEETVAITANKVFSADVGLSNYGVAAAKIVLETFDLGEDGIWRKTRRVTTPNSVSGGLWGSASYPTKEWDMELKAYVDYQVTYYRRHFVNEPMTTVTANVLNGQLNDDATSSEVGVNINDFGLIDGHQLLETRVRQA